MIKIIDWSAISPESFWLGVLITICAEVWLVVIIHLFNRFVDNIAIGRAVRMFEEWKEEEKEEDKKQKEEEE